MARETCSPGFLEKITKVWTNREEVAELAFGELFNHDGGFDYDDQIRDARRVGILVGETKDATPEEFIRHFEAEMLNEDEEEE